MRMTRTAACVMPALTESNELLADPTSSPRTRAARVAMRPAPSFTVSRVSSCRWCSGRKWRTNMPSSALPKITTKLRRAMTRELTIETGSREGGEDRAAHDVAEHDDNDGLPQAELEHDAKGAQGPVDGGDVGPCPDPNLLQTGGVLVGFGDGLDAVKVGPELACGRHDGPLCPAVWVRFSRGRGRRRRGQRDTAPTPRASQAADHPQKKCYRNERGCLKTGVTTATGKEAP